MKIPLIISLGCLIAAVAWAAVPKKPVGPCGPDAAASVVCWKK